MKTIISMDGYDLVDRGVNHDTLPLRSFEIVKTDGGKMRAWIPEGKSLEWFYLTVKLDQLYNNR